MKKLWQMRWLLVVVLVMGLLLTACGKEEEKGNEEVYQNLEESDYEFLVFHDPSAKMLLQSFMEHHPEIEIYCVEIIFSNIGIGHGGEELKAMIQKHGLPDLILGGRADGNGSFISNLENGIDLFDLPGCYEKGYIADLSAFCANDVSLDVNAYFPGTFEIFQDKDHLYALPLGISMDFMLTTESKYNSSAFSELEEDYTGRELMEVLLNEVEKEREIDEFFCPEEVSPLRLLYQLGGVMQTEEGIQVDEEIFQQVYEFTYLNDHKATETKTIWNEEGKLFSSDEGFVQRTALEPRAYEGKFTVSFWACMDAPGIALSYATTANRYHMDEETKAIYIPNLDDGNAYTASVEVYGAVGAESREPELAYELLRMLMDEEISYFKIHDDSLGSLVHMLNASDGYNVYPVNKERALELLDNFENQNAMMLYGHQGQGRYFQILDIVPISEKEKEKHEKMLNGISGMTYLNYDMRAVSQIIGEHQGMDIEDYKVCYDKVVKALNADLPK